MISSHFTTPTFNWMVGSVRNKEILFASTLPRDRETLSARLAGISLRAVSNIQRFEKCFACLTALLIPHRPNFVSLTMTAFSSTR